MKTSVRLLIFIFAILFSYSIIAQPRKALRGNCNINFPKKIIKSIGNPFPAGTYTIGTTGDIPTIVSAFDRLSMYGITGPVTFKLIDTLYQVPTNYYLEGPIPGAGPNSRITIQPDTNKNVTIQNDGEAVLTFINISYLTIDGIGLSGSTTLTIHALHNNQFNWNDAVDFFDNSDHDIVQNITAKTEDYTRNSVGIGFMTTGAGVPDSNLIFHNFVPKAGCVAIIIDGETLDLRPIGRPSDNVIKGNTIGSETDGKITWGISVEYCDNTIIESNTVQNVRRNFIADWVSTTFGINTDWCNGSIIRNNVVHDIYDNGTLNGATGILIGGNSTTDTDNNSLVYNNMIYDISNSSTNPRSCAAGIQTWYVNNPMIYYNSIYLNGRGGMSSGGSADIYITDNSVDVQMKNNILVNTVDDSPFCASAIYDVSTSNLNSDYNDLFCRQNQYNCIVRIRNKKYSTLSDWRTIIGRDMLSINEMPHFMDRDLHIDKSFPTNLESHGIPIAGIDIDFDGDLRSSFSPDIGADEFDGTTIVSGPTNIKQVTIAEAKKDDNHDLIPDYSITGDTVMVTGVITSPNFREHGNNIMYYIPDHGSPTVYYLQDTTGGIELFSGALPAETNFKMGDSVFIIGIISQYCGDDEIVPLSLYPANFGILKNNAVMPEPIHLTLHQYLLNAESYEDRLIEIDTLYKVSGTWPETNWAAGIYLTDNGKRDTTEMFINATTNIGGTTEPVYPINVVGIAAQYYSDSTKVKGGYEIIPRNEADITHIVISRVNDNHNEVHTYKLFQNYPNPFNPTTTIKYSIPKQSYVTIKVYDILGREVVTLVNEEKPAGNYEVVFSPVSGTRNLASGIYIYQLKATPIGEQVGNYVKTKKMILLR